MTGDLREHLAAALAREQLAAALAAEDGETSGPGVDWFTYADALMPIVRAYAANQLTTAAHQLDDGGDQAIEVALGGAAYVHRVLCDRAAALREQP